MDNPNLMIASCILHCSNVPSHIPPSVCNLPCSGSIPLSIPEPKRTKLPRSVPRPTKPRPKLKPIPIPRCCGNRAQIGAICLIKAVVELSFAGASASQGSSDYGGDRCMLSWSSRSKTPIRFPTRQALLSSGVTALTMSRQPPVRHPLLSSSFPGTSHFILSYLHLCSLPHFPCSTSSTEHSTRLDFQRTWVWGAQGVQEEAHRTTSH